MSDKWYTNDWFLSAMFWLSMFAAAVGNYYIHGGRIVW